MQSLLLYLVLSHRMSSTILILPGYSFLRLIHVFCSSVGKVEYFLWSHLSNAFQAKSWDSWHVILAPLVIWNHGFFSRRVHLTVAQIDMTFKLVLVDLFFNLAQRYYVSKETATFLVYTQLGKWLTFLPIKTSSSLFLLPWTV